MPRLLAPSPPAGAVASPQWYRRPQNGRACREAVPRSVWLLARDGRQGTARGQRRVRTCATSESSEKQRPSAVMVSRQAAARRATGGSLGVRDELAEAIAGKETMAEVSGEAGKARAAVDSIATLFLDDILLKSTAFVTDDKDYRQVVIVGLASDTRAYRLPWYEGTVIYLVAAPDDHQAASAALKGVEGAHTPRGSLLRRVPADLQGGTGFAEQLEQVGFQGDRLSVWCLQGLADLGLSFSDYERILLDISDVAALGSIVCGECTSPSASAVDDALATVGLLGKAQGLRDLAAEQGRLWDVEPAGCEEQWLFRAEQQRLSLSEMGTYGAHLAEAEAVDEDFNDNFS